MTINERVSPETLENLITQVRSDGFDDLELALLELQQYRAAAEPVVSDSMSLAFHAAITDSAAGADDIEEIKTGLRAALANYAAPQVTSVPEQVPESLKDRLLTICDLVEDNDEYCQDIWNACRAAMLSNVTLTDEGESAAPAVQAEQLSGNTEQVSQPYTLPSDVRNALVLALQAMEFMGDTLNNLDAVCTEDVEHVTPAFEAVRTVLADNSPAIPDGYALVPVEPTQAMIDAHVEGVQSGGIQKGYRAMLAAAPKQEAE
ncbi:TPA: hypothetical protein ACGS5H_002528 [Escherichia coli]